MGHVDSVAFKIQTILVPHGAEHRAVCGGLRQINYPPAVIPVPVGERAIVPYLHQLHQTNVLVAGQQVLMVGLCGGLAPDLKVGDVVLYDACLTLSTDRGGLMLACDRHLTASLDQALGNSGRRVTAITSNRVISRTNEKQQLARSTQASVIDMEGFVTLQLLTIWGISIAMLRVVSDDCQHDIPDLSQAFDPNGNLKPLSLTIAFLKQPIAAQRLIRGSITGLRVLQYLTVELFKDLA